MFQEDYDIFLNDFGEDVVFGSTTFKAIFYNNATEIDDTGFTKITSTQPILLMKQSSANLLAQGDSVTLLSAVYTVDDKQPRGDGFCYVTLFKV